MKMRDGLIVVIKLAGFAIIDFCSGNCRTDSFEKGARVLFGRSSAVVAVLS